MSAKHSYMLHKEISSDEIEERNTRTFQENNLSEDMKSSLTFFAWTSDFSVPWLFA